MNDEQRKIVESPAFLPRTYKENAQSPPAQPSPAVPLSHAQAAPLTTIMQGGYSGSQRVVVLRIESVNGSFQFILPAEQAVEIARQLHEHASGLTIAGGFPNGQGGN